MPNTHSNRPFPVASLLTAREFANVLYVVKHETPADELRTMSRADYKTLIRATATRMHPSKMGV